MTDKTSAIFDNAVSRMCKEYNISVDNLRNGIRAERFDKIRQYVIDNIAEAYGDWWTILEIEASKRIREIYAEMIEQAYEGGRRSGLAEAELLAKGSAALNELRD
jgi:hypothetical protein